MRRYSLYLILFLGFFVKVGYGQLLDTNIIYDFVNKSINNDSIVIHLQENADISDICADTNYIYNDTLFSQADIIFLRKQISHFEKFKWDRNKLPRFELFKGKAKDRFIKIKPDSYYQKKYKNGLTIYSIPLFSLDGKYCVFSNLTYVGHDNYTCKVALYKKTDDRWQVVHNYSLRLLNIY